MVSITLSVPEDLKVAMEKHPELNWSEIARQAIRAKLVVLQQMDLILKKSKFTEKDALELGKKINKTAAERLR